MEITGRFCNTRIINTISTGLLYISDLPCFSFTAGANISLLVEEP
jgi:hypothetical protein